MKKLFLCFALGAFIFSSCENEELSPQSVETDMSDFSLNTDGAASAIPGNRQCQTMEVLQRQLSENPDLYQRMFEVELHTRQAALLFKGPGNGNGNGGGGGGGGGTGTGGDELGTINIPVIVHVLYNNASENISSQQVDSQIAVLNEDFNIGNSDLNQVPNEFASVIGDIDVNFTLSQVIRVPTTTSAWGTNNAMKFSSNGGSDVVTPSTHLNIWVCNIGGGILGYAQFPGGSPSTDGVVIAPQYFGRTGTAQAPFDAGRTGTHEVGHYLNLRHIWGDGRCKKDDFVADTPSSDAPNYGCPSYPTENCRSNDMTMNYMDYTNDDCMFMFSDGQRTRMRTIFTPGGPRDTFIP